MAGHGTHVAGIVDQVAPAAKIMPLRVLDSEGYGDAYTIARAIAYAQRNGADVINLSLGTSEKSRLLQEMVARATGENIVVAAAAGNSGTETAHYPAAGNHPIGGGNLLIPPPEEGLLAVTSVNSEKRKSEFASYGFWVGISAPGENIRSTFLGGKYANWSGTSMATPFVSGQAALIRAANGSITSENIEKKIRDSADEIDFPTNDQEYFHKLGKGHANVCASLSEP